jgi:hypothetical protein
MIEKRIEDLLKDPVVVVGLCAAALVLLQSPASKRPDVPGLHERRNSAWRGRGSFGKAPFGTQVTHRR